MRISDWSSDVCSSDLFTDRYEHDVGEAARKRVEHPAQGVHAGTATVAEQDHRSFGRRVGCARENFLIPGRFCGVDLIDAQHQAADLFVVAVDRSEEHTSELQSLMRTSYAVFCSNK